MAFNQQRTLALSLVGAVTISSLLWPTPSGAILHEFTIAGVVTSVDDDSRIFDGLIEMGAPYSGEFFYYDYDELGSGITTVPNSVHYHREQVSGAFGITLEIGEFLFETDSSGLGELTIDDGNRDHDFFWMSMGAIFSDEFAVHRIDLRLEDPTLTAFSTALPPPSLSLADFAERSLTVSATGLESFINLDIQNLTPIPEPASALYLMTGLGLLASRRRRTGRPTHANARSRQRESQSLI